MRKYVKKSRISISSNIAMREKYCYMGLYLKNQTKFANKYKNQFLSDK